MKWILLFMWIHFAQDSAGFSTSLQDGHNRISRQARCREKEVPCKNGQCVKRWNICDGVAQCTDGSDESRERCATLNCPTFTFRCGYGACVDEKFRCNGIKECADNSDEDLCPNLTTANQRTTTTPWRTAGDKAATTKGTTTSAGCVLPAYPAGGSFTLSGKLVDLKPGEKVATYIQIKFFCRKNHTMVPNTPDFFCKGKNMWFPNSRFPRCIATCPALISSTVLIKSCKRIGNKVDCGQPVRPGTIATLGCKPLYEYADGSPPFSSIVCSDGSWDYSLNEYRCNPVCGRKVRKRPQTLVGAPTVLGSYPWQIAVYRDNAEKDLICGGSIITQKIVLSAARCFTDFNGNLYPKENYVVAAGKYYRDFSDARDTRRQVSKIKSLHVPERYKGLNRNYDSDMAVVVVETTFVLTVNVQPVCVDWKNDVAEFQLQSQTGVVTGWGYTKEGKEPSLELKQLEVPYVPFTTCYDNVPAYFRVYLTEDKMCAGFLNETSVCQGDSGGPLVFKNGEKYFIRGIVSIGPIKGSSCDSRQYGAYTRVSKYIEFITPVEATNRAY